MRLSVRVLGGGDCRGFLRSWNGLWPGRVGSLLMLLAAETVLRSRSGFAIILCAVSLCRPNCLLCSFRSHTMTQWQRMLSTVPTVWKYISSWEGSLVWPFMRKRSLCWAFFARWEAFRDHARSCCVDSQEFSVIHPLYLCVCASFLSCGVSEQSWIWDMQSACC